VERQNLIVPGEVKHPNPSAVQGTISPLRVIIIPCHSPYRDPSAPSALGIV
jgi:hypothetical protein